LDTGFGNVQLRDTLKTITEVFKKLSFGWFWYIFGLIMVLGFIHAIGPGHSKWLLISYILDRDKWFWQWLIFTIIFSLVHLADIIVLFLVTKLFFSLYDPTEYMVSIQRISIIILFFFSIYIFIQSIIKIRNKDLKQNKTPKKLSDWIFLAFVAGLAPCSFWWSIFLILFSMWKIIWIIPLLIALAIGIWLCLFCILIITLFLREKLYTYFSTLPYYSSVASSVILIFLSVYLFVLLR
jgi:ABC-type nickel/cobalt efflux system permease component RcnA